MIKEILPFTGEFILATTERRNIYVRINLYDTKSHNNLVIVTIVLLLLTNARPSSKIQLYSNRSNHRFDFQLNYVAIFMLNRNITHISMKFRNKKKREIEHGKKSKNTQQSFNKI